MQRLAIPASNVAVTRLGLGCARLFGAGELQRSARLIEAAMQAGIRHFDTAPAYGSEDVLGAVLTGCTDVTITTKFGVPRMADATPSRRAFFGSVYRRTLRPALTRVPAVKSGLLRLAARARPPASAVPVRRRLDRDEVARELSESLRRLRRTSIDLYLLHEPQGIEITDEDRMLFESFQTRGLIGAFGLAYGDGGVADVSFGTVTQRRYGGARTDAEPEGVVRIYHGIIRHGAQELRSTQAARQPGPLVSSVLQQDSSCAAIFSASSAWQIADIARGGPAAR